MSRLSRLAVSKRSVTLLLAFALFIAGISAWGSLKQELLPDIEFPVITVIAPFPGAGASDVAEQVAKPIEQVISGVPRLQTVQSTSANSIALVIAQFTYGTDVKAAKTAVEDGLAKAALPATVNPDVSALNINAAPVIIASVAGTSRTASTPPPRSLATRSSPRSSRSMASPGPTSPAGSRRGSSSRSSRTSSPRPASPSPRSPACSRPTT